MIASAELAWMLALHLVLTALPGVAAALWALRRGLTSVPLLLGVSLVGSGVAAMLAFWAFYADPLAGESVAFLLAIGSAAGIGLVVYLGGLDRSVLRALSVPLALWVLASAFVLYLGFVHGGTGSPLEMASTRFSHPLPADNAIPRFFADWFYAHGHDGPPPPFGDWLSSDRPPLQTGYVLAQRPFGWSNGDLHYEVIGVVVQQLWVVGIWALLCAVGVRPFVRGLVAVAALVSDIAIVHGFFVWPKLIAAALLLAALAMVLSPQWSAWRREPLAAALFAALCGLAMLAHGSSAFFLIPLLVFAALRGMPDWRWLGVAIAVGLVLLAPWSAYQQLADPPGDRLLKWQLGGSLEIDDRGAPEAIVDGYREAGLGGTLENKWGNVTQIVGAGEVSEGVSEASDAISDGQLGEAVAAIRFRRFYALLPCLGLLLLGPIAMLVRALSRPRDGPREPEWRFALTALALCAAACLVWVLLLFGLNGADTTIHVGSLAVPLLAIAACVVGAWASYPRLAVGLVAVNAVFVLALYAPAISPLAGTAYSPIAAILAAAGLAGFVGLAMRAP
jgi:hypothetical protein